MNLEKSVEISVICGEKHHDNEPLNYYCQNCKVCICGTCGQTRHANHTKVDIKKAAEEQKLNMEELVQEMKLGIAEHMTQMEKTTEMLKKNREKITAARNKVLTTVEELIRVLKEHEVAMVTKLDVIENEQQRDCSAQLEHFQISAMQLKMSMEHCERILERNNSVEILEAKPIVIERCKGLLSARKVNIYKPSHVQYKTNEEDIQNVRHAFLGEVIVSTTDPLQSVAEGKGLKEAEAGGEAGLTITTNNSEGNQCYNEIDQIVVKVRTPSEQDLDTNIADNEDGKYSVTYTPEIDGHHDVVIEVNGQPLTSSPWSVHVEPHQYMYHAVRSFGSRGKARGQFDFPSDIAINAKTGNIAVADRNNKRVQLFSPDRIYLREYGHKGLDAKKLDHPVSVAFNRSGDVTICDSGGIFWFTESGQFINNISNKHLIDPGDMTIASDGRMLVCDRGDNKVKVLSNDGTVLLQSFSAPGCHDFPWLALRHQDTFYVSYGFAHCVKVFNNEGEFLSDIGTEGPGKLHRPAGLAVDKFNNLVVCDAENVQIFKLEGKFVNSIKGEATELMQPWTVTVSNTGQLFITDTGKHCVHIFE